MSKITNVPKRNNFVLKAIRGTIEHRATWLYLLSKEGEKKGVKWEDIGYPAIRACGNMHGKELIDLSGTSSLKGLKKKLFTKPAQMIFDMKILESTDNKLSIDFGYCPLVAAWQKLGCTDEEIGRLCDIAMEGDRGIAESFGGKMELGETIANGYKKCQIRFIK
ncbi:MAG: L-2-amino-thiazoline-4-carboxylic acid hydrolase [Deltaproteobacteria bacterium]|nr:L-2-amino-thiazoline-4-carboxylic acid hydrolase [Deltaproteobacteria bacterium]